LKEPEPPKRTKGDVAHAVARAAIGSLPVVGAAGAELFAYVVEAPYEDRKQEWMREVGDAIAELRDNKGVDVEVLRNDPAFTDMVLAATQAAMRTREEIKRTALRNAVLHSALPGSPDESIRLVYVRLIDELTPWHLRILTFFRDPRAWYRRSERALPDLQMSSPAGSLEDAFPELRGRRVVYDLLWRDLFTRGLVNTDQLHTSMSGPGAIAARTQTFGEEFLDFTSDPGGAG
jgi:hypothetical protein